MKALFTNHVLPFLAGWSADDRNHVRQKVYRTIGLSENTINNLLRDVENAPQLKIGYYPVDSEVHVTLTVIGKNPGDSDALFAEADARLTAILHDALYGVNQETMAQVVGSLLRERRLRLCVAESCTGGLISSKITEVPGSSEWFAGGIVAYSNELKEKFLSVDRRLLAEHGAVSAPVVRSMARGMAMAASSPVAVAVTGIAGPTGGTPDMPIGTVYFGLYHDQQVWDRHRLFTGSRTEIQELTAQTALDLVRRALLQQKGEHHGRYG
jgi:nicotinamide-nucleotide amidase